MLRGMQNHQPQAETTCLCLIDEAANIGQIPNLEKLVATIRSREISACLVLQAKSQLKAIYKDNADTIIGNMDSQIFLGGTEQTTLKDLNAILGKETIDMYNTGQSKGSQESYNMNYQKLGKDLMTMDELAVIRHLSKYPAQNFHIGHGSAGVFFQFPAVWPTSEFSAYLFPVFVLPPTERVAATFPAQLSALFQE